MQYVRCFRHYVSANSAALPMSHWRYVLRITYPYYPSLSGACTWECYMLRITYPYYASLSGPCTSECYGLRITYPYYVSSAESPPKRAMEYALRIRIIYQAPNHNTRRTQHTGPETDPRSTRDRPETDPRPTRDRPETDLRSTCLLYTSPSPRD